MDRTLTSNHDLRQQPEIDGGHHRGRGAPHGLGLDWGMLMDSATEFAKLDTPKKRSRTRATVLGVTAVIVAAVAIGAALTGALGGKATQGDRRPVVTVGTAVVAAGDLPVDLRALGTATPAATATVTPRVSGAVTRVAFTEGQIVRKGQLLAEIDPRPYAATLAQAEGQMQRDRALLQEARVDLQRYQTLLTQDSISKQQVDTQAALVHQYEGTIGADKANVDAAQLNLDYCRIVAPIDGRVGLRQVDPGNNVVAGNTTALVVITQTSPMDVVFTIPQDQIAPIIARQQGGTPLNVSALARDGQTVLAQGQLLSLDDVIDVSTGTLKAKARFANAQGALLANQFIVVDLLVDTLHDAMIVPASAIRHGPDGDFVWVVAPDKSAEMRSVSVGPADGERASIARGLRVGEVVVTEGGDNLRAGSPVSLPGSPAATRSGPHAGQIGKWQGHRHRQPGGDGASGSVQP